jgi:ferredoxin-NADP reductase
MRYETWYYLHLYTYLAIALSFAHVFATGQEFASHPFARVLWSALYLFAAGAVVWHRIATPAYRTWRHRMRVGRVVAEGPGVVSIVLRGRHVDELGVQPGQFVRLRFLSRDLWWAAHPFSLSAAPHGDLLRVTVKHLGDHTGHMPALRHGTRVLVEGPYGALTAQRRTRRKVLLLAGGIGITPLRALFQSLPAAPGDLTLVYRAERPDDLVLRREIETLAERREQAAHFLPGRVGGDRDVLVGDRLRRLLPDLRAHDVYVCGPPGFVNAATAALRRLGVSRRHIHSENFAFGPPHSKGPPRASRRTRHRLHHRRPRAAARLQDARQPRHRRRHRRPRPDRRGQDGVRQWRFRHPRGRDERQHEGRRRAGGVRATDRRRPDLRHAVRPGAGAGHRVERPDHRRRGAAAAAGQRP